MANYVTHVPSPLGTLTLSSDGTFLTGLRMGEDGAALSGKTERDDLPAFEQTRRWLDSYFSGIRPEGMPPLRTAGTPFEERVWALLQAIPLGETTTYGALARKLEQETGKRAAAQAVGGAVGRNPIAVLIPCHRVVGANGALTGYRWGLERKAALLQLESGIAACAQSAGEHPAPCR